MADPVLLYVATEWRAQRIQRDHDPDVVRVLPIFSHTGHRASAIIVERPPYEWIPSATFQAEFDEWMEWLPTRLAPGEGKRITLL
jgi:hypothetical protein